MLNSQLKVAYRAQQKAQIAESKASEAKRRFASYMFHDMFTASLLEPIHSDDESTGQSAAQHGQ